MGVLHPLYRGSKFPTERPLLCIGEKYGETYHVLNEDDTINIYTYNGGASHRGNFDMVDKWPEIRNHVPLQKFVQDKRIEVGSL